MAAHTISLRGNVHPAVVAVAVAVAVAVCLKRRAPHDDGLEVPRPAFFDPDRAPGYRR